MQCVARERNKSTLRSQRIFPEREHAWTTQCRGPLWVESHLSSALQVAITISPPTTVRFGDVVFRYKTHVAGPILVSGWAGEGRGAQAKTGCFFAVFIILRFSILYRTSFSNFLGSLEFFILMFCLEAYFISIHFRSTHVVCHTRTRHAL